ncbi:hypothetical protein [Halofilum ochraceum]|uniref:hypothetical protein n=1 Tax=Halofilum ochraceum TaxID=1611323 RepID=UPI0011130803|nr:hypothetical protein [Halofilum ochraceum]
MAERDDQALLQALGGEAREGQKVRDAIGKAVQNYTSRLNVGRKFSEESLNLVNEWQSARTKSIKRFILGYSFLLIGAGIIRGDLEDLSVLGLQPVGNSSVLVALYLGIIIAVAYTIFESSVHVDKCARDERCRQYESRIPDAVAAYKELQAAAKSQGIQVEDLNEYTNSTTWLERYREVDAYYQGIRSAHGVDTALRSIDAWAVRALSLASILSLLSVIPKFGVAV